MDQHRKYWNESQKALRQSLTHPDDLQKVLTLFLAQHGMVHAAAMAQQSKLWSFEDEVLDGLDSVMLRMLPANGKHSIAWLIWHMTRIEDLTMNMLVAGRPQIYLEEGWQTRLKATVNHTGNAMDVTEMEKLSASIDLDGLRAYRLSVGKRTRTIVSVLQFAQIRKKVDPLRLEKLKASGALLAGAHEILNYWGGLTVAGLLLMPPTRHTFLHWNEAARIKKRLVTSTPG